MKNSAGRGGCYPPRPKAEVDNILRDLQNSSYSAKAKSIIALLFIQNIFFAQTSTNLLAAIFLLNKNNTISSPAFFGQRFNNLMQTALLTSF